MNHTKFWKFAGIATLTLVGSLVISCSKSSDDSSSTTSSVSLSGSLSVGASSGTLSLHSGIPEDQVDAMSVDITAYTVVCATQTTPPQTASSSISSDGSFNVAIPGAAGQPLSCYLVDANGTKKADFLISDSSKKDLRGNNQVTNSAAFKSSTSLGSISFDPSSGEVTVPATNIASNMVTEKPSSSSVFDPSGSWTIGAVDFTLPSGVKSPCVGQNNSCQGPPEGQAIYLKLWKGLVSATSADVYALQVWQSQSGYNTCSGKIGLTSAMKTSLGVDFSANGSADAAFTFATSVANFQDQVSSTTGTVNLTSGWKMDTAKTQYDMYPCGAASVTIGGVIYNSWKCGPDSNSNYQLNLSGGCVNSAGDAVNLTNWSGVNNCSTATDSNGIKTTTCTGTATINSVSTAVTCTNKYAVVDGSNVVQSSASFNFSDMNASKVASGTLCSAMNTSTSAKQIQQLQCYANYYWSSGMSNASACLPRLDTDWTSSDPATFAVVSFRPQSLIFMEQFNPFSDGSGGSILSRQEGYRGVQVSSNNFVNCKVIETGALTIKKISDTKMLATYQSSEITTSTSKSACLANFTGARSTYVFYLTK